MGQLRVVVVRCPPASAELCADHLMLIGAAAIEERVLDRVCELRTTIDNDLKEIRDLMQGVDASAVVEEVFVERAVLDAWKQHAQPTVIDETLTIVPAWLSAVDVSSEEQIFIDPEESFGIGDHPTTRLCAAWLHRQNLRELSILDAGCGSGVLSIIAARNGAFVTAVDIAENAITTTLHNAALNHTRLAAVHGWSDLAGESKFELIVANILAPVLIDLAPLFISHLNTRGRIALAGLRTEQVNRVLSAYPGFKCMEQSEIEGWELLILQRD